MYGLLAGTKKWLFGEVAVSGSFFCFACSVDEQNCTKYISCQNKFIYSIDKQLFFRNFLFLSQMWAAVTAF